MKKIDDYFKSDNSNSNEESNKKYKDIINSKFDQLGYHIRLKKSIYESIIPVYFDLIENKQILPPSQIFTGAPSNFVRKEMKFLTETKEFIKTNNINLYIHGPYIINLGRISSEITKGLNTLYHDLKIGSKIRSKGVVVHVGHNSDEIIGTKNMEDNINTVLSNDFRCKLLLETPAAQTNELLSNIDDFINFCLKFKDNKKFGIVIDTCHVFSSNYNPYKYLKKVKKAGLEISLIHLNNSKTPKGSKRDLHSEDLLEGFIPLKIINKCIKFGLKNNIDLVMEPH